MQRMMFLVFPRFFMECFETIAGLKIAYTLGWFKGITDTDFHKFIQYTIAVSTAVVEGLFYQSRFVQSEELVAYMKSAW